MNTVDKLYAAWGVRPSYPVTEEEFFKLVEEEGDKTWIIENQDNGDGTFTNELVINEHRYKIVTRHELKPAVA